MKPFCNNLHQVNRLEYQILWQQDQKMAWTRLPISYMVTYARGMGNLKYIWISIFILIFNQYTDITQFCYWKKVISYAVYLLHAKYLKYSNMYVHASTCMRKWYNWCIRLFYSFRSAWSHSNRAKNVFVYHYVVLVCIYFSMYWCDYVTVSILHSTISSDWCILLTRG